MKVREYFMKYILFTLAIIFYLSPLTADTRVDGFFPESLVQKGYFADREESTPEKITVRPKFFISREERRLHPDKAPSNSIQIPRHVVRVSNRPFISSNGAIGSIWASGIFNQ